ncbi:MAG: hypothetical protein IPL27_26565 [Lewinellaceae bacterium]|nr:hypothetical protein [Lewinellaceae bacterium]
MIYNLCGSIEDYQSLVLDFDDMFELLKNLLSDFGIPKAVNDVLVTATTYIFIGFQFDKWYTQLLLRYVNKNRDRFSNAKKNYASKTVISDENTKFFFQQQFNLTIYGGDWQFLHLILHRSTPPPKNTPAPQSDLRPRGPGSPSGTVQQYRRGARTTRRIRRQLNATDRDEVTMYKSNYYAWLTERRDRTTTQENLDVKIARIRKASSISPKNCPDHARKTLSVYGRQNP